MDENPSLKSSHITISGHIEHTSGLKNYTTYTVDIDFCGHKWSLHKRYSDFVVLHEAITYLYDSTLVPQITGKRYFDFHSQEIKSKRQVRLQIYLHQLLEMCKQLSGAGRPEASAFNGMCRPLFDFLELERHSDRFVVASAPCGSLQRHPSFKDETLAILSNLELSHMLIIGCYPLSLEVTHIRSSEEGEYEVVYFKYVKESGKMLVFLYNTFNASKAYCSINLQLAVSLEILSDDYSSFSIVTSDSVFTIRTCYEGQGEAWVNVLCKLLRAEEAGVEEAAALRRPGNAFKFYLSAKGGNIESQVRRKAEAQSPAEHNMSPSPIEKYPPMDIALQLAKTHHQAFKQIPVDGQTNHFLMYVSSQGRKDAAALISFINQFDELSRVVCTDIVMTHKLTDRQKKLGLWIEVAACSRLINDFMAVMAITGALQNSACYRLKATWAGISSDGLSSFERLATLCSPKQNFGPLREATNQAMPPAVPFIGLYTRDLTFLIERQKVMKRQSFMSSSPANSSLNMNSMEMSIRNCASALTKVEPLEPTDALNDIQKQIDGMLALIQGLQQSEYRLQIEERDGNDGNEAWQGLDTMLQGMSGRSDDELHSASLLREPRQAR